MYKETAKERVIRFSIIAAIATVTLYLLVNQYSLKEEYTPVSIQNFGVQQMAVVLQEKKQEQDFPRLAMVKEHDGGPILVTYRVDIEKDYRFETQHAINLKNSPTDMQLDENTDGIWLKEAKGWTYYNPELQIEKRAEKYISKAEQGFTTSIEETETGKYLLKVNHAQGPILEKILDEKPVSVVRLSEENDLWYVLFEKETILLVP